MSLRAQPPSTSPEPGDPLHRAIVEFRRSNGAEVAGLFDALAAATVSLLTKQSGELDTALAFESGGSRYIAVFTRPEFAAKCGCAAAYPFSMKLEIKQLCARIRSERVGLVINPDHEQLLAPLAPGVFRRLRELIAASYPALVEGGLYHVLNEDGSYGVLKILKIDDGGVHLRHYSNRFAAAPLAVDESELFMAGIGRKPEETLGMGHLPLSQHSFVAWKPTYVQKSTVSEAELEGYRVWREAKGGYF